MKTPRFPLLAACAAFALSLACHPTPLRSQTPDDAKRREAAEEFLKVRRAEDVVNGPLTQMGEVTDRISDNIAKQAGSPVDPKEFSLKLRAEARDTLKRELGWETLRPEFVQAYSQAFTEAELRDMIAFYQTPTGKKLAATDPQITGRLTKISQEKMRPVLQSIVQHLGQMVAATKPPPPPGASPANPLAPPSLPPGLTAPPPPPPGMMIPPPPPPGMIPNPPAAPAPPAAPPVPAPPVAPSSVTAPGGTPAVHPGGKTEPGTP